MLFSTSSLAFILISLFSNGWLQRVEIDSSMWETNCQTILPPTSPAALETLYYASPSLGPVFSCETACPGHIPARSLRWMWNSEARVYCRLSLWGGGQKPAVSNAAAWTGSLLLLSGSGILLLAHSLLCLSLCKRELCGRSVFQVTGLLQCVAGMFLSLHVTTSLGDAKDLHLLLNFSSNNCHYIIYVRKKLGNRFGF